MGETAHADPLLGSMLGKNYRVLERIGMGGMAVVYLVEHEKLRKKFAAKILLSEHASSEEARARFTQEAHSASQLDHDNIVSITDFGVLPDQRPFFVMELLRGQTLAQRLDQGPMSLEEVVAVSVPAARALAHAHAEGVVHRDVKPENIFLVQRSQGRWGVKVLDFGIAKVPVNDRMTKTGQTLGSPMFMAPEACRGDEVDQRADVYSFGILLYLMLAGRVPFDDKNILKVLQMQVTSELPKPSTYNPNLDPALEDVIMRALVKDREARYSNMEELLVALEEAVPDGADALLIQAQFGATTTPFPGSLERVRTSARLMSVNASGSFNPVTASGRFTRVTGNHDAARDTPPSLERPMSELDIPIERPEAPRRGRAAATALVTLLLVGAAGAGGYVYLEQQKKSATEASESTQPTEPTPTTPTSPTAVAKASPEPEPQPSPPTTPPPTEPAVVEPADVGSNAVTEPTPTEGSAAASVESQASPKLATTTPKRPVRPIAKAIPAKPTTVAAKPTPAVKATPTKPVDAKAVAPVPPTPTPPIETAPPPTTPTPAPKPIPTPVAPTPKQPKVDVGSLDATPAIAKLDIDGSLPSSVVRRSIERVLPSLRTCYQAAAKAKQSTPALTVSVRFEIDEGSAARRVTASGSNFASLDGCVRTAMARVHSSQAPDVGTVNVTVGVKFTPN